MKKKIDEMKNNKISIAVKNFSNFQVLQFFPSSIAESKIQRLIIINNIYIKKCVDLPYPEEIRVHFSLIKINSFLEPLCESYIN